MKISNTQIPFGPCHAVLAAGMPTQPLGGRFQVELSIVVGGRSCSCAGIQFTKPCNGPLQLSARFLAVGAGLLRDALLCGHNSISCEQVFACASGSDGGARWQRGRAGRHEP
ncbi:unnamed protein product [Symbiodinium natans]|uniref:Uncharacterized protein n=1 Tax=Symbiodinium natans TaxID=878477 RepID=A0A812NU14_9DINO|nr:unnamed protein product [Symbiodinium natans]